MPLSVDFQWLLDQLEAYAVVAGLFAAAFILSTIVIRVGVPRLSGDGLRSGLETKSAPDPDKTLERLLDGGRLPESASSDIFDLRSTGFWIGFCETFLIFVLVFADAFNALAIIIGAKQFVRSEKIKTNPSYYLLGTLANLSIAILFALIARGLVQIPTSSAA